MHSQRASERSLCSRPPPRKRQRRSAVPPPGWWPTSRRAVDRAAPGSLHRRRRRPHLDRGDAGADARHHRSAWHPADRHQRTTRPTPTPRPDRRGQVPRRRGRRGLNEATLEIDISENHAPVCPATISRSVESGSQLVLDQNPCTDADGDPLTLVLVDPPDHGTLTGPAQNGSFTYAGGRLRRRRQPDLQVDDASTESNVGTLSITVTAADHAPVCSPATGLVANVQAGSHQPPRGAVHRRGRRRDLDRDHAGADARHPHPRRHAADRDPAQVHGGPRRGRAADVIKSEPWPAARPPTSPRWRSTSPRTTRRCARPDQPHRRVRQAARDLEEPVHRRRRRPAVDHDRGPARPRRVQRHEPGPPVHLHAAGRLHGFRPVTYRTSDASTQSNLGTVSITVTPALTTGGGSNQPPPVVTPPPTSRRRQSRSPPRRRICGAR